MTKLTCYVTTCASNQNECCCRPQIQVQGRNACKCGETECQSFQKKGKGEMSNAVQYASANTDCTIKCTAEHCIYNSSGDCTASQITIDGNGAETRNETNCKTFREK